MRKAEVVFTGLVVLFAGVNFFSGTLGKIGRCNQRSGATGCESDFKTRRLRLSFESNYH